MGPQFSPLQNGENHKYLLYSIVAMIKLATHIPRKLPNVSGSFSHNGLFAIGTKEILDEFKLTDHIS